MAVAFGNNISQKVSLLDHLARKADYIKPMYLSADQSEVGGEFSIDFSIDLSSEPATHLNSMPSSNTATTSQAICITLGRCSPSDRRQGTIDPAFVGDSMHSETGNTFESPGGQPNSGLVSPVIGTETEFTNPHTPENYQSIDHGTYQSQDATFCDYGSQLGNTVFDNQIPGHTDDTSIEPGPHKAQYVPEHEYELHSGSEVFGDQCPAYTLQSAHASHSIMPRWGLTQRMWRTQHTHLDVQHQAKESDVPVTQLLKDPSFRQYVDQPEAGSQRPVSQTSAMKSVSSGRALKPVITKAGKLAKYRKDGKLRKSTLGPLAERPAEELQTPDIDLTGSDVMCFFPNYIRRPRFLTRMLGNGFSSRTLAAAINFYNGTDKTANSINNGCVREARQGWNLSNANEKLTLKDLRAKNLLAVDNSLRIAGNDLPMSKLHGGESPRSEVTLCFPSLKEFNNGQRWEAASGHPLPQLSSGALTTMMRITQLRISQHLLGL
ncbi:hypothetical protein BDV97DRAFT_401784 [Delphinella strobiligena]|nr:hypothetical protein BDV97DRAFT_401784 [Delphinella strobiligena]